MTLARLLAACSFTFFSVTATAQMNFSFTSCQVLEVVSHGPVNVHVQLSCPLVNPPSCATAPGYFAFDGSTVEGKRHLAMLLMAQSTGGKVTGIIEPTCPTWQSNVPLLQHLRLSR